MGGAIATAASYISMAVYIYFVVRKFYPVNYETGKIAALLLVDAAALAVFYIFFGSLGIAVKAGLSIILISSIVYISQLYKIKSLLKKS